MLTIRAMTGGEGYAQRHLQQSDYYDQNRTVKGQWHGRGAELLGLKKAVTPEDFEAVRQGLDPQTGEFLRQRHGADRIASNGEEQSKARSLYDMTFSAPKSVSVMAIVGGDERLVAAHETAVCGALEEAEKYSATGLVKPDAAEQLLKPRVAAHGIEEGVYFEPLQDRRLLFVGLVAPEECLIVIAERQVRSNKGT